MKLTKSDRDAFVLAVMQDVPKVDYDAQAREIAMAECVAALHPDVRKVWENKDLRHHLETRWVGLPGTLEAYYFPIKVEWSAKTKKKLDELSKLKHEQGKVRNELRNKVAAMINGCSTLKQATDRLPEFLKYLPASRDGTGVVNLPVVSNVVADLTKAGWPKKGGVK